jgi:hypothetical protein
MLRSKAALMKAASLVTLSLLAGTARAQTKPVGWSGSVNLSGVVTSGNAQAHSFGLQAAINRNWLRTSFFVNGGGTRQDSVDVKTFAVGSIAETAEVQEASKHVPAASYFAEMGFERRTTERFLFHLGEGYERSLSGGLDGRVSSRAGVGFVRMSRDKDELKLLALATYTFQREEGPDPNADPNAPAKKNPDGSVERHFVESQFVGARLALDYSLWFGRNRQSSWISKLAVDENLEDLGDYRVTWDNAVNVTMTDRLALQLSAKTAFRNQPAEREVDVVPGTPGARNKKTVAYGKLDNTFQVALVINWSPRPPSVSRPTR